MCGLTGCLDFAKEANAADLSGLVQRMADALVHRGPDDAGVWMDAGEGVALGFRRLSILDLSPAGRQPMCSSDGRYVIVLNGEIYNHRDLRDELGAAGTVFRGRSDTEVVLEGISRWGFSGALERLWGMFAIALWDRRDRTLLLARDRLGKKPLYYGLYGGRLAIASELKALLADPRFPREIDPEALDLYLRFGYVPAPHTVFRAARKLPSAHWAVWDQAASALRVERYWDPVALAARGSSSVGAPRAEEALEALLTDAVRRRMIADVPLGAFLSGGVDSSLVVALMRECGEAAVKTFSIRFENPAYDEADHARAVARHLGAEHHEETCSASAMLALAPTVAKQMDEPFADSSIIPTYAISKMAHEHVTVALTGDGGDELFFGYPRYHARSRHGWLLRAPRHVRHGVAAVASRLPCQRYRRAADVLREDDPDVYRRIVGWWPADDVRRMTGRPPARFPAFEEAGERVASLPPEERPPVQDVVTYLPEDILTKVDRATMAAGLEARAPLLDHRVVELALSLPLPLKWRAGTSKWLLRKILYRKVPPALLERPKMGFGVPLTDWLRGPMREDMEQKLFGGELEALGLDPGPPRSLWAKFKEARSHRSDLLWSVHALIAWSEHWRIARDRL